MKHQHQNNVIASVKHYAPCTINAWPITSFTKLPLYETLETRKNMLILNLLEQHLKSTIQSTKNLLT